MKPIVAALSLNGIYKWTNIIALLILFSAAIGCKSKKIMELISSEDSGIYFNNTITDNDSFNILDVENIYNGGGVGIADFNNDGLRDVYFTGNLVSNKLYLNKGSFKFQDITDSAGVSGNGKWSRGVSVVDINNDGWMDMYVCASLLSDARKRENLLYINMGTNKGGIPQFKDMSAEYGLNDTSHSTMAAFFDYDNDGDLDMYLLVNEIIKNQYPNNFRPILKNGEHPNTDRLYRNDWNDSLKHPFFTNVSKEAGILIEGYGHGVGITDINRDGWKDIYVSNDFLSNNILYINNQNGTFTDQVTTYFKHTAENAMGQDIIDINNDGLQDVIELDMNPEDNYRKKMMSNPLDYTRYQNNEHFGYQHQYVRNVLQINQGPRLLPNDSIGPPIFSDLAFYSGISETDWSWTPMAADFDNDGFRDIIITNGFPKDVTDHDFIAFRHKSSMYLSKRDLLDNIPVIKIPNYAYRNKGDLRFADVTNEWGMNVPSFSNGAAYADLDNDGDLDIVMNNINQEAFVYKNNIADDKNNFLSIRLRGDSANRRGIGAWIELHYNGKQQVYENTPYRGYLSSVQQEPFFGLDTTSVIDSVIVKWPLGNMQAFYKVPANQELEINYANASSTYSALFNPVVSNALFRDVTADLNIQYIHHDSDFIDFNIQKLLPHKLSEYGPALAVADVDGNGLDDIVAGGSFYYGAQLFLQQENGSFSQKGLLNDTAAKNKKSEELGIALFDADNDGDADLYIAAGSYESKANSVSYKDQLYLNDGKGNFSINNTALPENFTSKSCVRVADFDRDGDFDLFVGGRVEPGNYPKPVSSFIYRNDSGNGNIKFTDITSEVAPVLNNIGLVCDATWTDFDNDGWIDLMLAGEFMPITFLKNSNGQFPNPKSQIPNSEGWWNSIVPGDFDNDGDMDYIVGNLGENSFYKGSKEYPVTVYFKDFDKNGTQEAITTRYLKDKDGKLKEYTTHLRDHVLDQMPFIKKRFLTYRPFAETTFDHIFSVEESKGLSSLKAVYFKSVYLENSNNGNFIMHELPAAAQVAPLNGMVADDFDGDGNLDVLINGNDFGTEVLTGRYDALNGLLLKGDGKGGFSPLTILQSGIFIPGNGKAMVKLKSKSGKYLAAASENRGPIRVFECKRTDDLILLTEKDVAAIVTYKNGKKQRREFLGSSFLGQSGRILSLDKNIVKVTIIDAKGNQHALERNK